MSVNVPEPVLTASRKGGLDIYGDGSDGDISVIGAISLTRDMYYNNLTVFANSQIDTNGFRIFVKNTLHLVDSTSVIGRLAESVNAGTLLAGAASGIKASDTLGGDGGLNVGENLFAETEFYNLSQAIVGYKFNAVTNQLRILMGGSGGKPGDQGSKGADGVASPGGAGSPGSAGSPGNRPGFENSVGSPGGKGRTGATGNPGNVGSGGIGGDGGPAGLGGTGGGVVVIASRYIIGSGIVRADGFAPGVPGEGTPGTPGSSGNPGSAGNRGSKAPDFYQASYTQVNQNAYYITNTYNFTNPPQRLNANYSVRSNTFGPPVRGFRTYTVVQPGNNVFVPSSGGNLFFYRAFGRNPGSFQPGTRFSFRRGRVTGFGVNPGRFIPGNPFSFTTSWRNPFQPAYGYRNPPFSYQTIESWVLPGNPFSYTFLATFSYVVPGNPGQNFGTTFVPASVFFSPEVFHQGGAGGAGGAGGTGGSVTAGLPGAPGTQGYAGGGGVVLLLTEKDLPLNMQVRAAAGIGDGGFSTAGTVIIIKNEEETV